MDAVMLARIQFALTIGFHYLFPPLTIGLGWMIFHYNNRYQENGDAVSQQLVITSYSIHYTKLYEAASSCGRGRPRGPWIWPASPGAPPRASSAKS